MSAKYTYVVSSGFDHEDHCIRGVANSREEALEMAHKIILEPAGEWDYVLITECVPGTLYDPNDGIGHEIRVHGVDRSGDPV